MPVQLEELESEEVGEELQERRPRTARAGMKTMADMEAGVKCANCGATFRDGDNWCSQCGTERAVGAVLRATTEELHDDLGDTFRYDSTQAGTKSRGLADGISLDPDVEADVLAENQELMERVRELERINADLQERVHDEDLGSTFTARKSIKAVASKLPMKFGQESETPIMKVQGRFKDLLNKQKLMELDEVILAKDRQMEDQLAKYREAKAEIAKLKQQRQEQDNCISSQQLEISQKESELDEVKESLSSEKTLARMRGQELDQLKEEMESLMVMRSEGVSSQAIWRRDSSTGSVNQVGETGLASELAGVSRQSLADEMASMHRRSLADELSGDKEDASISPRMRWGKTGRRMSDTPDHVEASIEQLGASALPSVVFAEEQPSSALSQQGCGEPPGLAHALAEARAEAERLRATLAAAEEERVAAVALGEQRLGELEAARTALDLAQEERGAAVALGEQRLGELEAARTALTLAQEERGEAVALGEQQLGELKAARATLAMAQEERGVAVVCCEQQLAEPSAVRSSMALAQDSAASQQLPSRREITGHAETAELQAEVVRLQDALAVAGVPIVQDGGAAALRAEVTRLEEALASAGMPVTQESQRGSVSEGCEVTKCIAADKSKQSHTDEEPEISGPRKQEMEDMRRELEQVKAELASTQARESEARVTAENMRKELAVGAPRGSLVGAPRGSLMDSAGQLQRQKDQQELLNRVVQLQKELALARKQAHEWKIQATTPWYERILSCNSCASKRPTPGDTFAADTPQQACGVSLSGAGAETGPES